MVSRCVEHINDANSPHYSGTVVSGADVVTADGNNCNMVLDQCASRLQGLHNHNATSSSSNSNNMEQPCIDAK